MSINFEHISHIFFGVSNDNIEQVIANWPKNRLQISFLALSEFNRIDQLLFP